MKYKNKQFEDLLNIIKETQPELLENNNGECVCHVIERTMQGMNYYFKCGFCGRESANQPLSLTNSQEK